MELNSNINSSELLNKVLIICAKAAAKDGFSPAYLEDLREEINGLSSEKVSLYLSKGLDLIFACRTPDYISLILAFEYEKLAKTPLTDEELKSLVYLKEILVNTVQMRNYDLFYTIFSNECPPNVRDEIILILGNPWQKEFDSHSSTTLDLASGKVTKNRAKL